MSKTYPDIISKTELLYFVENSLVTAKLAGYDNDLLRYIKRKLSTEVKDLGEHDDEKLYFGESVLPSDSDYEQGDIAYKIVVYNPLSDHWFLREYGPMAKQNLMDHEVIGRVYADISGVDGDDELIATAHQIRMAKFRAKQDRRWVQLSKKVLPVMQKEHGLPLDELVRAYKRTRRHRKMWL